MGRPNSSLRSLPPVARAALSAQRPPRGSARAVARYLRAGLPHTGHKPRRAAAWLHWAPAPLAGTRAARDQKRVRSSSHAAGLLACRLACPPPARSPPRASRRRQLCPTLRSGAVSTEMSPGQLLHALRPQVRGLRLATEALQPRLATGFAKVGQPRHAKVATPRLVCLSPPHPHEHPTPPHTRRLFRGERLASSEPGRVQHRPAFCFASRPVAVPRAQIIYRQGSAGLRSSAERPGASTPTPKLGSSFPPSKVVEAGRPLEVPPLQRSSSAWPPP